MSDESGNWRAPETLQAILQWPLDAFMRLFFRECGAPCPRFSERCKRPVGHRGAHFASFVYMGMACMYHRWADAPTPPATVESQ